MTKEQKEKERQSNIKMLNGFNELNLLITRKGFNRNGSPVYKVKLITPVNGGLTYTSMVFRCVVSGRVTADGVNFTSYQTENTITNDFEQELRSAGVSTFVKWFKD